MSEHDPTTYDFIVIGSGFGGSVSALRLAEKGYSVLVLEKGKRYMDQDFPESNWSFWKYLWMPVLRSFGILQMSLLDGMLVLHGAGVGGGSLGYASVLMEPTQGFFNAPQWRKFNDWGKVLKPHYAEAKKMLGVAQNPILLDSDLVIKEIAEDMGKGDSFSPTSVGIFFGPPGEEGNNFPDPYFNGDGPERNACQYCGGCMVGCRYNSKNTLVKNYLYFAEQLGVEVRSEVFVNNIQPLENQQNGARYSIEYQSSTSILGKKKHRVRTKNVVFSAGVMGTLKLLFHCRDISKTLPKLSQTLGDRVRTNSETLVGSIARRSDIDYAAGIAIGSIFQANEDTNIEPTSYPRKSGLMRLLAWPLIDSEKSAIQRLGQILWFIIRHPIDFLSALVFPGWAKRTIILLVMQTKDNMINVRFKRKLSYLFKHGLSKTGEGFVPTKIEVGHEATHRLSEKINGIAQGSIAETLLGMPSTAHILGGALMGNSGQEGLIDKECRIHNYPGLYIIDGSIIQANPGINPSLTITALAEYANSNIPPKD